MKVAVEITFAVGTDQVELAEEAVREFFRKYNETQPQWIDGQLIPAVQVHTINSVDGG